MNEPTHTLYAYVDGYDLGEVAGRVETELRAVLSSGGWRWRAPVLVNRRLERTPDLSPEDLPVWDLGVSLELPEPGSEPPGWFSDVERIAKAMGQLHAQTGRDFVFGIWDAKRRFSEDLYFVESANPDLDQLRAIIGDANAS